MTTINGHSPSPPTANSQQQVQQQQQLVQAAQAFESIFVRNMIGAMRQSSLGDDLFGNSGGNQFRDMLDDRIADDVSQNQGLGIAELLIEQWKDRL